MGNGNIKVSPAPSQGTEVLSSSSTQTEEEVKSVKSAAKSATIKDESTELIMPGGVQVGDEMLLKAGIPTTQILSDKKCQSLERFSSVAIVTSTKANHVFLILGVYFTELEPLSVPPEKHLVVKRPYHFCIWGPQEFLFSVIQQGHECFYWPKTKMFYRIPAEYVKFIQDAAQAFSQSAK
jgi:hypothetical protein